MLIMNGIIAKQRGGEVGCRPLEGATHFSDLSFSIYSGCRLFNRDTFIRIGCLTTQHNVKRGQHSIKKSKEQRLWQAKMHHLHSTFGFGCFYDCPCFPTRRYPLNTLIIINLLKVSTPLKHSYPRLYVPNYIYIIQCYMTI